MDACTTWVQRRAALITRHEGAMNVLLITQDFPPATGGIQTYCRELAAALAEAGARVTVLTSGPRAACDGQDGIRVIRYPLFHSSYLFLWAPLIARTATRRVHDRPVFDAVLCAQWQAALWRLLPGARRGPRCVSMVHGSELSRSVFGALTRPMLRLALRHLDGVAPNSAAVLELTRGVAGAALPPARVIHPGVDPARFCPPVAGADGSSLRDQFGLRDKKVLLTVTRLVARKNVGVVIDAMPAIVRHVPEAAYVVVGEGPERPHLQSLAAASPVGDRILFTGPVPNERLPDWYQTCDAFILPSRQTSTDIEGFGIVCLEAGACGKPVIGADTGGIREAVPGGSCGILLENPDSVEEVARAVVCMLDDSARAAKMGRAARERILRELTWHSSARHWMDFLRAGH
jgi:phosphatidylinositol alpha-1,6-mannosyltransferase